MIGFDLNDLSRVALAVVCAGSAGASAALAMMTHPKYTPHMILVAFWSLWAAAAMVTLAFGTGFSVLPDEYLVINLNGAFIVALGGWALFAMRLWREAVLVRRAESILSRSLRGAMDSGDDVTLDPTGEAA